MKPPEARHVVLAVVWVVTLIWAVSQWLPTPAPRQNASLPPPPANPERLRKLEQLLQGPNARRPYPRRHTLIFELRGIKKAYQALEKLPPGVEDLACPYGLYPWRESVSPRPA